VRRMWAPRVCGRRASAAARRAHGRRCSPASRRASGRARARARWFLGRLADNFKSARALRAFAWGYVPVVGGASAWGCIVFLMIAHFLTSCVEQFAQSQATYAHNLRLLAEAEKLRRRQ